MDAEGHILPSDGVTEGELQIRGHWVLDSYFGQEKSALTWDGWFDTGDIATLDPDGYMVIRDRSKDIIKSGGEWISTVDLENIAISHPQVANAAAIAARHPKWDERPVICAQRRPQSDLTEDELLSAGLLARREGSGETYDRFRHRVMFPVRGRNGAVHGFVGRDFSSGWAWVAT